MDGSWLVPLIVIVVWFVNWLREAGQDKRPLPRRPVGQRPAPPAQRLDPQQELEVLLRDLGLKRPEEQKQQPVRPEPRPARVEVKPPKQKAPKPPAPPRRKKPVKERHLVSDIETRPTDHLHSGIEEKHLVPTVAKDLSVANPAAMVRTSMQYQTTPHSSQVFRTLLTGPANQLPYVLVLGQLLGTPVGLRDEGGASLLANRPRE